MASPHGGRPVLHRRLAALGALVAAVAAVVIAVTGIVRFPLSVLLALVAAVVTLWGAVKVVSSRGWRREIGGTVVAAGIVSWILILVTSGHWAYVVGLFVGAVVATALATAAIRPTPHRPAEVPVPAASRAFILMNPWSGGGKVAGFGLAERARELGAEVVLLERGMDVVGTLRAAVARGADVLGAAGGDGTQALVAKVAADHQLPVIVIPAGTRNHFARDLGLDRGDPRRALDALREAVEIRVDLGEVAGRPFVNNVSLGLYAEIVKRPEYRDAKLETTLAVLPDVMTPSDQSNLEVDVDRETTIRDPVVVQVGNNRYAGPSDPTPPGTRPRLDTGELGIDVVAFGVPAKHPRFVRPVRLGRSERSPALRSWSATALTVRGRTGVVPAGVDGEYLEFRSPLVVSIRPGALRVRLPRSRPGPKARWLAIDHTTLRKLWSVLAGHEPLAAPR
jgi:diacylglycerol kinase family enzyme